jgi:hypothetical protein
MIKIANAISGIDDKKGRESEATRTEAMRFMWMPGERPVIVPEIIPINKANKISINIPS